MRLPPTDLGAVRGLRARVLFANAFGAPSRSLPPGPSEAASSSGALHRSPEPRPNVAGFATVNREGGPGSPALRGLRWKPLLARGVSEQAEVGALHALKINGTRAASFHT